MRKGVDAEVRHFSETTNLEVVVGSATLRYCYVRSVGEGDELGVKLLLHICHLFRKTFFVGFKFSGEIFFSFSFFAFALFEKHTDLFGDVVLFSLNVVGFFLY